jgi:hypothetical protein
MQEEIFESVALIARHAGLQLWDRRNTTRSGRYCIVHGRDILHHADDLDDAVGWLSNWTRHVH